MTGAAPLRAWWGALAGRERGLLGLMLVVLLAALVWFAGVAPALRIVRSAPAQIAQLDSQWVAMQGLAAQARGLQSRAAISREDAVRELEASVRQRLGASGQLSTTADRVTVVLQGAAPQAMAPWLSQARQQARVVATQANLSLGSAGWDGTIVFNLPPAP
jgi:general secretion pathway protein M